MSYTPDTYAIYANGSAKAGSARHYEGPRRGECAVDYDGSLTFYKIPRGMRSGFRRWVRGTWSNMNGTPKVVGAWPHYTVEFN